MIHYDYPLYRPPSEANSLIFQVTLGCSHNRCLFCSMYKSKQFRIKPLSQVIEEIKESAPYSKEVQRVFLADGDALALPASQIIEILKALFLNLPNLKRISAYASAGNLLKKSVKELEKIKNAGLDLIYMGLESGDPKVLEFMEKGSTPDENIQAVLKAKEAGMTVSVMVILGLGGKEGSNDHAMLSAKAVSQMNPPFLSALTLMLPQDAPLYDLTHRGQFKLMNSEEILLELRTLIKNIEGDKIVFRTSHASNYLNLRGVLPKDNLKLIEKIDEALCSKQIRPDFLRGL